MKGLLVLMLAAVLPASIGSAQDNSAPQGNESAIFTLELTDELIEDLKNDPKGLFAKIPPEKRGLIAGVKLYYKPTPNRIQPQNPAGTGMGNPGDRTAGANSADRIASNRPAIDEQGFSRLQPNMASRQAQSTIFQDEVPQSNPSNLRSVYGPQLPETSAGNESFSDNLKRWQTPNNQSNQATAPVAQNQNTTPTWPDRSILNRQNPDNGFQDTGFSPIANRPADLTPAAPKTELEIQFDLYKRKQEELQAQQLAEQEKTRQREMLEAVVAGRVQAERELWIKELRASQQAGLNSPVLGTGGANYGTPTYDANGYRIPPTNDGYQQTSGRIGSYGEKLVGNNDRTITQVAMAPRSTDAVSPPELNVKPGANFPTGTDRPARPGSADPANDITTEKTNGALLLMLLCSVALNIYLSWIARGFYVRYNDLADDLRETFSTTV